MLGSAEDCVGVLDESDHRVTAAQCADADTNGEPQLLLRLTFGGGGLYGGDGLPQRACLFQCVA